MSENDKDKEIKKMSEAESYDEYEEEAIEDVEESPSTVSEDRVPLDVSDSVEGVTEPESEQRLEEESVCDSYEDERETILREKWLSWPGKKPRNIPVVRKPLSTGVQKVVFFGDMRQMEVERNIQRRMLLMSQKIHGSGLKFGIIRHEIKLPALFSGLLCIQFDPTAEYLACSNRKGGVEILQTSTGERRMNLNTVERNEGLPVRYVKYLPHDSEKIYVVGQTGSIQVFNTATGEQIGATEAYQCMFVMDISPDGKYLATGGVGGKIEVIDPYTLQVISRKELPKIDESVQSTVYDEYHRLRIYGLKFHGTDTNLFATGSWDDTVKVWDIRTSGAIRSIRGPGVHGDGLDIRGNEILTATCRVEDSLSLWDFNSGRLIKKIPIKCKSTKFEGEFPYVCRFFKDNPAYSDVNSDMIAVGGSGFYNVIIINIKTDTVERYFSAFKPVMCLDVIGNLLAYGGTESVLRVAQVDSKSHKKHTPLSSTKL